MPLLTQHVREPITTLAVVTDDGKGNPRYAFYREAEPRRYAYGPDRGAAARPAGVPDRRLLHGVEAG